jgi:hypothetical protein
MLCVAASSPFSSNVVDIFNVTNGSWSTAVISQGRWGLAATSLPSAGVAIFAGGKLCASRDILLHFSELVWRGGCMAAGNVVCLSRERSS